MNIVNKITTLFTLIALTTFSCVDSIDFPDVDKQDRLVVEGYITDLYEPVTVRLTTTSALNGTGSNTLGQGATVTLVDGAGNLYPLKETSIRGEYTSESPVKGLIGQSYHITITLSSGSRYKSTEQTIPKPVTINSSEANFIEEEYLDENFLTKTRRYHELELTFANQEQRHFYKIDANAYAEAYVDYDPQCVPLDSVVYYSCWRVIDRIDNELSIGTNQDITAANYSFSTQKISFDRGRYIALVSVKAMSEEAYLFWEEVKKQLNQGENVFDPPLTPITGNISSIDNPDENVLGFFHAYAISSTKVCIDRRDLPGLVETPILCYPTMCTEVFAPAVIKPPFGVDDCF